jgi:type IV pilus assembly protein PilY1
MIRQSIGSLQVGAHGSHSVACIKKLLLAAGVAATLFASQLTSATPLSLAQAPLFVSAAAPANIFILSDDSGSMDWNIITSESDGVMLLTAGGDTTRYTYLFPQADNAYGSTDTNGRILPSEAAVLAATNMPANAHGVWRGRYSGYNSLYYDPAITYRPWQGVDNAGVTYADAISTAARLNPFDASTGTVDLTASMSWTADNVPRTTGTTIDLSVTNFNPAMYYTWTDSNSNGVVDAADAHTLVEITSSTTSYAKAATRTDCAGASCTYTEEIQNFANWFSYHRRRSLTAKNAIGNVVAPVGSEVRMGHGAINNNSGNCNIQIAQMNSSVSSGAKRDLLDAIYGSESANSTPLRTALYQTGRYYQCASGSIFGGTSSYTCPWLSAASGGTCQQSFTILMTDGYYNDSFSSLPGSGSNAGQVDRDGNSPNTAGNTSFDGGAYADDYAQTLADVAMHFYERDLRTGLANNVPVFAGIDNASHQHMVTYGVAFGVTGTLSAGPTDPNAAFTWPDPDDGDLEKIDDLRHAAYNGRGKFLSARDPVALANSLKTAIDNITATTGSASAVAVNSRTLTTGTTLYQARFTSVDWSGDLRGITLDATTGDIGAEVWSAKNKLQDPSHPARTFLTYRRKGTSTNCSGLGAGSDGGVAFSWGNLSQLQQCLLNDNPETAAFDDDAKGDERVDYLRGDTTLEGTETGDFRVRTGGFKLGDIVNSTPAYVGVPVALPDYLETPTHSSFLSSHSSRREMLYVGANDGMLHGFAASGTTTEQGQERLAFVPSQVYENLNKLTDPNYRNTHQFYVDGSPTVGDAFGAFDGTASGKNTGCSGSCWRSVLVGGLAGGGKGIFALDVTDPDGSVISGIGFSEANATNIVLWEFIDSTSATPDDDMGYVYGEVSIAKMRNGKWVAVFGNGYNSVNENAVLYFVCIDGSNCFGSSNSKKIVLNPYATATGNSNGLSAPMVYDRNADYVADYVYAGDLRGNLWKVDVSNIDDTQWASAYVGSSPQPLFRAVDSANAAQAITAKPTVDLHPGGQPGYMVYIGTGRYVASGDKTPASSPINTMYGIWDKNVNGASTPVTRGGLLGQTITQYPATGDVNNDGSVDAADSLRVVSSNIIDWTTHLGWALDLRTNQTDSLGEMSVTNPVLATSDPARIIFTTLVPTQTACAYGGTGWLMEVSPVNGGNLGVAVFDINNDGAVDATDLVGGAGVSGINPGIGIMPEVVVVNHPTASTPLDLKLASGSTGAVKSVKNYLTPPSTPPGGGTGPGTGRRSWRQLQ